MKASLLFAPVLLLTVLAAPGMCSSALFTSAATNASGYQPLDASALFSLTGNQLTIQVADPATGQIKSYIDSDVITALQFSVDTGAPKPANAVTAAQLEAASTDSCLDACHAGNGWQYRALTMPDSTMMPRLLFVNDLTANLKSGSHGSDTVPTDSKTSALGDPLYAAGSATTNMVVPNSFTLATIDHIAYVWANSASNSYSPLWFASFDSIDAPEPSTWMLALAASAFLLARRSSRKQ